MATFAAYSFTIQHHISMKKQFALALFLGASTLLQAQFLVGGQIGFGSTKFKEQDGNNTEESTLTTTTLLPRLGFSFGNMWAGVDVGITNVVSKEPTFSGGTDEDKASSTNIGGFLRFIKKPNDNMGIWAEVQAGAGFGKTTNNGQDDSKFTSVSAGVRPGVILFLGEHLSFEASFGRLGFTSTTVKDASPANSDYKVTNTNAGLSLNSNNYQLNFINEDFNITGGFLFAVNWMF
jgi:hypothetical protein